MVTLVIMDGFGINQSEYGNAIKQQGTPNLKKLKVQFAHTQINASGESVGLSDGVMGNSEVGHLNLGAGRIVYQDLTKINKEIKDGVFFKNKVLLEAIQHTKTNKSTLHIMGLCSDGCVHSHIEHLKALIDMAETNNANNVCLHLFLDGRDTAFDSGINYAKQVEQYIQNKNAKIASLCGRLYAMDREKRFDRVEKAYNMLTLRANQQKTLETAFSDSYAQKVYDEFFEPTQLVDFEPITNNDAVIFFNFRTDRARELTEAITQDYFDGFKTQKLQNLYFATFTEYDAKFQNIHVAFPPEKIDDNLSAIISQNNLKQLHITETTKYAHVTFFFNGGNEKEYPNETRKLIESENVVDFSQTPNMRAYEITEEVLKAIDSKQYDFILVNLSNADMVGHSGDLEASIKAIKCVDECASKIALATLSVGGDCIITADHGNAEELLDETGKKVTAHTTNPVPLILVSNTHKNAKLISDGKLANIAPTVLKLLGIKIPQNMENPMF